MLCPPPMEKYWGKNRGRPVRTRGTDEERGGGGRKSGPKIRKQEEEQRENRGAWILRVGRRAFTHTTVYKQSPKKVLLCVMMHEGKFVLAEVLNQSQSTVISEGNTNLLKH